MKILQLCNHLFFMIQGPSAAPHISASAWGGQAALAGLVLGSRTAARPVTGCTYLVYIFQAAVPLQNTA